MPLDPRRGKGSHGTLYLGTRFTVVKHGERASGYVGGYAQDLASPERISETCVTSTPAISARGGRRRSVCRNLAATCAALSPAPRPKRSPSSWPTMIWSPPCRRLRAVPPRHAPPQPTAVGQVLVACHQLSRPNWPSGTPMRTQGIDQGCSRGAAGPERVLRPQSGQPGPSLAYQLVERALRAVGRTLVVEDRAA